MCVCVCVCVCLCVYAYILTYFSFVVFYGIPILWFFNTKSWVFANGPGDRSSIPGRVIPKTRKMVLDSALLNTQHNKVSIKGKVRQSREEVAPSPTPWCSSY